MLISHSHSPGDALGLFCQSVASRLSSQHGLIRILLIGDVVGRPGRRVLRAVLPALRETVALDFVLANGENAAGGFGITTKVYKEICGYGIDVVTMGNHWADKPDVHKILQDDERLVIPANLTEKSGKGLSLLREFPIPGRVERVVVLNLVGKFAMNSEYGNPFAVVEPLRQTFAEATASGSRCLVVDMHAEASSEKQAMGWYLDGVATAVVGTHTHTPTCDERILPGGTAFITDLGMVGPYESVIGMEINKTIQRYLPTVMRTGPHEVAAKDAWFSALLVEADPATGLSVAAHRLQYRVDSGVCGVFSVVRGKS